MSPIDTPRLSTGIAGLDDVLAGGLPRERIYLVQGEPGSGKTTLGLQFLLEGAAQNEPGLYISLSESKDEITAVAASHGWSLDKVSLYELSAVEQQLQLGADNTVFHPAEVELRELLKTLLAVVDEVKPRRVVFDSLSEIRILSQNQAQYRRQILMLKQYFVGRNVTVLLLDDRTNPEGDSQLQSLAHGVVMLEQLPQAYGPERRRLRVSKLRGIKFRGGYHDYRIETGGLQVYPRLVAAEHAEVPERKKLTSGLPHLDALIGGGLDSGTSTLLLGPAGSGKSSLMAHYAVTAAKEGRGAAIFAFDENRATLFQRARALGLDLDTEADAGRLTVRQVDPAELAPDELAHAIRAEVERGVGFVAIDSLNGYLNATPDERFLSVQLHELLSYLSHKGVVTVMVMAQHGLVGTMSAPLDITYIADAVVLLRFFEAQGRVRKAISVMKKRSGAHEDTIRELTMGRDGLRVSEPLAQLHGVLTGVPSFAGGGQEHHVPDRP
ncbi:MAG: AAA family ATPase [Archangiaceae bacterium]|nr:AAA family ATPase [Archangiaceae bacterium]